MNLSITNVPDPVVERLREQAERGDQLWTPTEILKEVERLGVRTPSESVDMIRADHDGRPERRSPVGVRNRTLQL